MLRDVRRIVEKIRTLEGADGGKTGNKEDFFRCKGRDAIVLEILVCVSYLGYYLLVRFDLQMTELLILKFYK